MFSPIRTTHAFQAVLKQITEAVSTGDLRVGDRLPSERDLAKLMDVSRPTVREAVRVLMTNGLLKVMHGPHGGSFICSDVVPTSLDEEPWQLKLSEVADLLEMRRILQPAAAVIAAARVTEVDIEVIESTWKELQEATVDRKRFLQLDEQFHLRISKASHNSALVSSLSRILKGLRIAKDFTLRNGSADIEWALGSQQRMFVAIQERNGSLLESETILHLRYLEEIWDRELERSFSRIA